MWGFPQVPNLEATMTTPAYVLNDIPVSYANAVDWNGYRYLTSQLLERFIHRTDTESTDNPTYGLAISESEAWELVDAWEAENGLINVSYDCWSYFYHNLIAKIV